MTENKLLRVKLSDVRIGNRIRTFAGDLKPLMASLERVGLLQPIVIDRHYHLVAGFRRLTSARLLGWEYINAVMIEVSDKATHTQIEIEENTTRLDFSEKQLSAAEKRLTRQSKPGILWKVFNWFAD